MAEIFTLGPSDRGRALMLLANAYNDAGMNGTAERIRRGVMTSENLIALAAIEAAIDKG